MVSNMFDICVVGSGAGGGPIAYELAKNGFRVVVIEKGPWIRTSDFAKDEIVATRREVYTPRLMDEPQVIEKKDKTGNWEAKSTYATGTSYWNGNMVGGSTNLMSGYFHRLKPGDFRLLSEYGPIKGANVVDWPISYEDLEPYYDKVEKIVGISGRIVNHNHSEPRSNTDYPYPPLVENVVSHWLDKGAENLGYNLVPVPRAILSTPEKDRNSCYYSNFCGSYGCSSNAKGSSRVALLNKAMENGNCHIIPNAKVFHLKTNGKGKITSVMYYNDHDIIESVEAEIIVVACQAVETSRLLLMSKNPEFPNGLANNNRQVGKNLIFSAGGTGSGKFDYEKLSNEDAEQLKTPGLFVNRAIQHWYEIDDKSEFPGVTKGGTVDFLFEHSNGISRAVRNKHDNDGKLIYGSALKTKLKSYFSNIRKLNFEVFADWLPNDDCNVTLDNEVKDRWGDPVARIKINNHPHDIKVGEYLASKAEKLLKEIGCYEISSSINGAPPSNLMAGGCRFGNDKHNSVLDANCKAHEVENLYVTDGSFMPTGGSVTHTWTIYANSFRVAQKIIERLQKSKGN